MKVAFYAPLKSPDHPVPSGDRQLARALLQALRAPGHDAFVASRFRTFDAGGDAVRQQRLARVGNALAGRLTARLRRMRPPLDVWFTYHLYHKAPDLLGPAVCAALDIPYVVAEASVAGKQHYGKWSLGYASSIAALEAAAATVVFNPVDLEGIRKIHSASRTDEILRPFLDLAAFVAPRMPGTPTPGDHAPARLITVAMMRPGAKVASYALLAEALKRVVSLPWTLTVVGDGPARADVEAAFEDFGASRVRFAGFQPTDRVAAMMRESDAFLWPAIDEAFGMVFIEAQASGLPVVAGDAGGVGAVVSAGRTGFLVPLGNADAFASATERLLVDRALRRHMGREASAYASAEHDLPVAAARIDALLRRVVSEHATRKTLVRTAKAMP